MLEYRLSTPSTGYRRGGINSNPEIHRATKNFPIGNKKALEG